MYIQHCICTTISSPLLCSQKKTPKNLFRIAHSHHLFQVRRVISYWKPFVASNYVIYFSGHCWGTYKWGTPEGKVILNTSSCLTLATFVEQKPSILPASWINCLVTMINCNKTAKATFVIRFKKKKKMVVFFSSRILWQKFSPTWLLLSYAKTFLKPS